MAAKTTTSRAIAPYRGPSRAAPIVITKTRTVHAKKKAHRKSGASMSKKSALGVAIAGFILGHVDKAGTAIPTIPMLGRAGTVAVGLYFLGPKAGIMRDAMMAAAAIAGYEMGSTGKILGQETGIASQI